MSLLGIVVAGLAVAGLATVVLINRKMRGIAAVQDKTMGQLEDLANAFDASTTAVGLELDDLRSQLQRASVAGQAPDPSTISRLQNISERLKSMTITTVSVAGSAQSVGTAPFVGTPSADAPNDHMNPGPQPTTTQTPEVAVNPVVVAAANLPGTAPNAAPKTPTAMPPAELASTLETSKPVTTSSAPAALGKSSTPSGAPAALPDASTKSGK